MPAVPDPVKPQEAKMAESSPGSYDPSVSDARKRMLQSGGAASTLLTGPSGVENSSLNLGRSTLLGA
jgi:hypothetical protein